MNFVIKDLQRQGILHLLRNERAALFAKMGKGKTGISLTAFDALRVLGEAKAMLVVAPLRVANLTWPNEVEKFDTTRHLRVANLRTKEGWAALLAGAADIYTINYEALPKLCEKYLAKRSTYAFDVVLFDELTAAKNPKSKRINSVRRYLARVPRRWGLTGTPSPNSLLELFGQVRLLDDGKRLGVSYDQFKRQYFYPTDYMEYHWEPFDGAKEKIYSKISDIALVLMDKDADDAPDPVVHDVSVQLPPEAEQSYRTLERDLVLLLNKDQDVVVAQSAATLVGKMLQLTGGAIYKTVDGAPSKDVVVVHDAKIEALKLLAKNPKHQPMLIACNYQHEQARILKALPKAKLWPKEDADQKAFLKDWNARRIPFVVAHPRSIGHGLNLQAGSNHVVWYSIPYSRELYDQLIARLVRRGQAEVTQVYRLLCPGTIDDVVAAALHAKGQGQSELLDVLRFYRRMLHAA